MTFAVLSATGMLGTGFLESSMRAGLDLGARAIGCHRPTEGDQAAPSRANDGG